MSHTAVVRKYAMTKPFKVKVKDQDEFESCVFGADDLLEQWPALLTEGAEVIQSGSMYYLCDAKQGIISDSAFFSKNEMQYLEKI